MSGECGWCGVSGECVGGAVCEWSVWEEVGEWRVCGRCGVSGECVGGVVCEWSVGGGVVGEWRVCGGVGMSGVWEEVWCVSGVCGRCGEWSVWEVCVSVESVWEEV